MISANASQEREIQTTEHFPSRYFIQIIRTPDIVDICYDVCYAVIFVTLNENSKVNTLLVFDIFSVLRLEYFLSLTYILLKLSKNINLLKKVKRLMSSPLKIIPSTV